MKVLFLDIDGVVNCSTTSQRHRGFIGIDPYMSILVDRIKQATGCVVVLSSTWRKDLNSRKEIMDQCTSFIDCTPYTFLLDKEGGRELNNWSRRGHEIERWLNENWEDVEKYAVLDDDIDVKMIEKLIPNYFQTFWEEGLTEEIANKVIEHLNG